MIKTDFYRPQCNRNILLWYSLKLLR